MAIDQVQEWLPDPTGRHRYRLYADGRPTEWVSDGNAISEDPLPPAEVRPAAAAPPTTPEQPSTQQWPVGPRDDPGTAVPPVRPAGFYRNAAQPDEVRYWDGTAWTAPPSDPASASDAGASDTGGVHGAGETPGALGPVQAVEVQERAAPGEPAGGEVPADWYPDPSNRTRLRYWDGLGWTEQVLDERPTSP